MTEENKTQDNMEKQETSKEKIEEVKQETSKEKIEEVKTIKTKKTEAVVNAKDLPISTKHSIAICNMIRGKNIEVTIELLEKAEKMKIPVPMRGEIPHKKGIMSGRYPIKALGHFIKTLKSLKANAIFHELEIEKYVIFCKANLASRPYRRFGKGKFKRTHLTVKLIIPVKKNKSKRIPKSKNSGSSKITKDNIK